MILEPDKDEPEWWAGAPSVARDKTGTFWLACRMRTADSPRGLRGYEIRILRSSDGIQFEKVHSIRRGNVPIPGFERPALLTDPATGKFKLYACGPWRSGPWSIIKFNDVNNPAQFDPASARVVIAPSTPSHDRDIVVEGYKDPFIIHAEGQYHGYVIGMMRRTERTYHFSSRDGERWEPVGSPRQSVMDLTGWHDFYVRPASVVPLGVGYLFLYEGSNCDWHDPVYNIVTGVGFTCHTPSPIAEPDRGRACSGSSCHARGTQCLVPNAALGENAADYIMEAIDGLRMPQGQEKEQLPELRARSLLPRTQPLDD